MPPPTGIDALEHRTQAGYTLAARCCLNCAHSTRNQYSALLCTKFPFDCSPGIGVDRACVCNFHTKQEENKDGR